MTEAEICDILRAFWVVLVILSFLWWLSSAEEDRTLKKNYHRIPVEWGGGYGATHLDRPLHGREGRYT